jgi:hypothetical protein
MEQEIQEKITILCSFVCNGKTYQYEQKLQKAAESKLYDAAIIYAWNIFMLFVYEKIWQIREIERYDDGDDFITDGIFLQLINKGKPSDKAPDYFDGNLFSLNKLHENNQGEDKIIGKLKDVFRGVDQQLFKEAQQILQKRNTCAHVNSVNLSVDDLNYVLGKLIDITQEIQNNHESKIPKIFEYLDKSNTWYLSTFDLNELHKIFDQDMHNIDVSKYKCVTQLVKVQDFSDESANAIKEHAIKYFLQSGTYDSAYSNGVNMILPILQFLKEEDIREILTGVFGNTYNQILEARKIEDVFWELYQLSSNNFPDLQSNWEEFASKLETEDHANNLRGLISEIRKTDE